MDGKWPILVAVEKVGVDAKLEDAQVASALRTQTQGLEGMQLSYLLAPSGEMEGLRIESGRRSAAQVAMSDGMMQSMQALVAPSRPRRFGIGAEWQVFARITTGGADIVQILDVQAQGASRLDRHARDDRQAARREGRDPGARREHEGPHSILEVDVRGNDRGRF